MKNISKEAQYVVKKSETITMENVRHLQENAQKNYVIILVKVASILGIYGGLKREELCNLEYDNLKFIDGSYAVTIRKSKTDQEKAGFVFYT